MRVEPAIPAATAPDGTRLRPSVTTLEALSRVVRAAAAVDDFLGSHWQAHLRVIVAQRPSAHVIERAVDFIASTPKRRQCRIHSWTICRPIAGGERNLPTAGDEQQTTENRLV